jgi:hypothetical protein
MTGSAYQLYLMHMGYANGDCQKSMGFGYASARTAGSVKLLLSSTLRVTIYWKTGAKVGGLGLAIGLKETTIST